MSPRRTKKRAQEGYALLMIMFFLAMLVLSMATAAPTVINDLQRDREEEMVWRGKQYVRGIRLFYQKVHRFPVELDDLTKPKTGLRFMRQAYKDPMNQVDGTWRLIYLGPGGVLIGSLKMRCISSFTSQPGLGGAAPLGASSSFGSPPATSAQSSSSFGGSSFSTSSNSSSSTFGTAPGGTAPAAGCAQLTNPTGDPNAPNQGSSDEMGTPHDIAPADVPPPIMGGSIIGVGSKVNKQSFLWYEKAKNYRLFEFVWDPSKDVITGRQMGVIPGVAPYGPAPGLPMSPVNNPGQMQNPTNNLNAPQEPPLQAPTNP
jgi:hypothetical protein